MIGNTRNSYRITGFVQHSYRLFLHDQGDLPEAVFNFFQRIDGALITAARTRPRLIGGERAVYSAEGGKPI